MSIDHMRDRLQLAVSQRDALSDALEEHPGDADLARLVRLADAEVAALTTALANAEKSQAPPTGP